jgi:hypothetical protein
MSRSLLTFYWRGVPNFGDRLGPLLVEALTGRRCEWAPAPLADLVVVGSILGLLPSGWRGTVLGAGTARQEPWHAADARILALRGLLTLDLARRPADAALGDPGLLVPAVVAPAAHRGGVVAVPHWQDRDLLGRWPRARAVDVRRDPREVVRQISCASAVVTSSLHGLIVADAYGIPSRWEPHAQTQGGGHKFRDHGTVVGDVVSHEWRVADPTVVHDAQEALMRAFENL